MLAILPLATVVAEDIAYADGKVVAQSKAQNDSTWNKRGLINRLLDYFNEANKPKEYKKFDFSIIGGPHYSTDTKFGLGLVAAGLYRADRIRSCLRPM